MATIKFKNEQGEWEELSAAKLETARNINGVPFDGTQDITIPGGGGGTTDYNSLENKPSINNILLIGNQSSSDLGLQPAGSYITTETDPTVPSWAKQPAKPTYVASEVGALPSTTTIGTIGGYPSNPTLNRFLRDDKTFSEIVAGSGGYAANVYLTNINSDIANYKKISYTPEVSETTLSTTSTNATTLIKEYLYDSGVGVSLLDAGAWTFSIYCKLNVLSGNNSIRADLYKKTALSGEVVLLSATSNFILNTDYQRLKFESNFGSITVDPADRIGVKLYFTTTSLTPVVLSLLVGGNNASYFNTPVALRHSQLRGFNDDPAIQHITTADKVKLNKLLIDFTVPSDTSSIDFTTTDNGIAITDLNLRSVVILSEGNLTNDTVSNMLIGINGLYSESGDSKYQLGAGDQASGFLVIVRQIFSLVGCLYVNGQNCNTIISNWRATSKNPITNAVSLVQTGNKFNNCGGKISSIRISCNTPIKAGTNFTIYRNE